MSCITIFTSPKPFLDAHITLIQRNAIRSWMALGSDVEVLLLGNEQGMAAVSDELGVRHLPEVACNEQGTPLVSSLFHVAREMSDSPLMAYVNADILLLPDFVSSAQQVMDQAAQFLLVGQRWDLSVTEELDFSEGWDINLRMLCRDDGRLHPPGGSDYFIYPRECFTQIPPLAIGRAGWDNWMIYEARQRHWVTADASHAIQIIHQDHDYRHLPGGQPHYRLPETQENVRVGGGERTIFKLMDADHRLEDGRLLKPRMNWERFWREVEIFPLVRLHSFFLGNLFFALFHPGRGYRELRVWLAKQRKAG
jgi:hypothetical protein